MIAARDFIGTWLYGPRPSAYHIHLSGEDCCDFRQTLNCGRKVQGTLLFVGDWLHGDLLDDVGVHVGSIRLRLLASDSLSVVSNFMFAGSSDWGPDTIARKHVMVSRGAAEGLVEEATASHPIPESRHGVVVDVELQEPALSEQDYTNEDTLARALSQIMEAEETLHSVTMDDAECRGNDATVDLPRMMSLALRLGGKMNDSCGWDRLWMQLERKGWRIEFGPKGDDKQIYYMPPNVYRCAPAKGRVDYFDSKKLVLRHLLGARKLMIDVPSEDVAAREAKPRARLLPESTKMPRCRRRLIATPQGAE